LVESTSKLESLEKINKEYAESIHKLKSEKENLETQIAELVASGKKEKESAQEKLDNTAQANFVLSEIVKESQRKVDRAELSVDKWVKRVEDKNSEIATLKQEIARIKKEGEEEKARLVEINNKIIANKSSLKNLLNGDLIDQDYLIDSLEDELKTLGRRKKTRLKY
jgi:chromosome segregation ATPase